MGLSSGIQLPRSPQVNGVHGEGDGRISGDDDSVVEVGEGSSLQKQVCVSLSQIPTAELEFS